MRELFRRKIKLGNKGFSLIELLAAIVILGFLATIAIVSVSRMIEKARKNHYATQEKNMVLSAQSYFESSKNKLPKSLGQQRKVSLEQLQEAKVIGEVLDYSKNPCDKKESFVKVVKYTDSKYSYAAYLKCSDTYETSAKEAVNSKPTVSIRAGEGSYEHELEDNETLNYKATKIKLVIEDPKAEEANENGILSYKYIVYKIVSTDKEEGKEGEKKETNSVEINSFSAVGDSKKEITTTIDLKGNIPGTFTIAVEAVNIHGNKTTEEVKNVTIKDTTAPECVYDDLIVETNGAVTAKGKDYASQLKWTNQNRKITIGCIDKESTCVKDTYTQDFDKDTNVGYIEISDYQGNKTKCKVTVKIDKTAPKITKVEPTLEKVRNDIAKQNGWTNYNYTMTLYGKDSSKNNASSGIKYYSYKYPTSNRDNGQEKVYVNYANSNTTKFETTEFSAQRNMDVYFRVCDNAGNCSNPEKDKSIARIRIDKTKPRVESVNYSSEGYIGKTKLTTYLNDHGGWANDSFQVDVSSYDPWPENLESSITSGVANTSYAYAGSTSWTLYPESVISDYAFSYAYTTTPFSKERNEYAYFRVCDIAGNCSEGDTSKIGDSGRILIKIDKTKPTCTNSGGTGTGNENWVNHDITLVGNCSDPTSYGVASGCATKSVAKKIVAFFVDGDFPGTVYDVAGNKKDCAKEVVQIDKTPPELTVVNAHEGTWYNDSYTVKLKSKDDLSGIKRYSYRYPTSSRAGDPVAFKDYTPLSKTAFNTNFETDAFTKERNMNVEFQVCDWAENCSSPVSSNIKIDKTKPVIDNIDNPYEGTWTNVPKGNSSGYVVTLNGRDPDAPDYPNEHITSGIDYYAYKYASTSWTKYDNSAGRTRFVTTPFTKERNEDVYFEICDIAKNCSYAKTSQVRIDTTNPTCTVTAVNSGAKKSGNNSSSNWSSAAVSLTGSCSDSGATTNSGCKSGYSTVTKTANSNTAKTGTNIDVGTIYDNAGNSAKCEKTVYIDQTAPTCNITANNTSSSNKTGVNSSSNWSSDGVVLTGICSDDLSECDRDFSEVSAIRSTNTSGAGTNVTIGTIKDNAGNTTACRKDVYVDKDPPTCSTTAINKESAIGDGQLILLIIGPMVILNYLVHVVIVYLDVQLVI